MLDMRKLRADSDAVKDGWRQEALQEERENFKEERDKLKEEWEKMRMQKQIRFQTIAQNLRKQGFSNEEIAEIMVLSLAEIENLLQRES